MEQLEQAIRISDVGMALKDKIVNRTATVAVIGAGYVGLPLAAEAANAGFSVICVDKNAERVRSINEGRNYIQDVDDEQFRMYVQSGVLRATDDYTELAGCDVVVVCLPTPLTENKEPDLSFLVNAFGKITETLRPGQLVSLESTTFPGTTEEILLPMLMKSGLTIGEDFFLSFSPERVDPGNPRFKTRNTPKVVGGVTPACLDIAVAVYRHTVDTVVPVSSPRIAELTKVFENTYRAVNIGLVNELALLCDRMNLDVWEVIRAASTKPFGIQTFWPGPGVGGHCIPLDPAYLAWKAREYDFSVRFIDLASEINLRMPYFVTEKLSKALGRSGKPLPGAKVLVLGVAYKRDVADERESPALKVIQLLKKEGASVQYHDPYIPEINPHGWFKDHMLSVPLTDDLWASIDAVVITTEHSSVDYNEVAMRAPLILDTRNAMKAVRNASHKVVKL